MADILDTSSLYESSITQLTHFTLHPMLNSSTSASHWLSLSSSSVHHLDVLNINNLIMISLIK